MRRPFLHAFVGTVGFFLLVPTLIVVPMSFSSGNRLQFPPPAFGTRWYENFFGSPLWRGAAVTSLKVALFTVILSTILGTLTALGLVRGRYPGRAVVSALVLSPIIVPVVVVAIGVYFVFGRWGLTGNVTGLVMAHTVLALPLVVVTVSTSLRMMDRSFEVAAQSLGANPWRVFTRITLPLILPGVGAGALFAFIISWDEIVIAIFLSSPLVRTLPVVIWGQVRLEYDPTVAAVSTMLLALSTAIVLFWYAMRRWTRLWI